MKNKTILFALALTFSASVPAFSMRPILRWESKLNRILAEGGDVKSLQDRSNIELNLQQMAAAKSLQMPEEIDEVRAKLHLVPHPDNFSGSTPNRGKSFLMDTNEDRPGDDEIPSWAIQNLTPSQRAIYDAWLATQ